MHDRSTILRRCLPLATFAKLRSSLQQIAERVIEGNLPDSLPKEVTPAKDFTLFLTENVVCSLEKQRATVPEKFAVIVSEQFSALLWANQVENATISGGDNFPNLQLWDVGLSFDPVDIQGFLDRLVDLFDLNSFAIHQLTKAKQNIKPNNAAIQSEFTLILLELLSFDGKENYGHKPFYPHIWVCQPVQDALHQQVEQERLLNQVTTQIRQSLELPVILKTAVEQVRSFLQADRLVIYQFEDLEEVQTNEIENIFDLDRDNQSNGSLALQTEDFIPTPNGCDISQANSGCWGRITYESKADDRVLSVLNFSEEKHCFIYIPNCRDKYRKGFALGVEDIESAYVFFPCLLELLRRVQVRAKLAVPIIIQERLWGLLIAHQCFAPRQWLESEKNFLSHIAEHLAIAIYQARIYAELQRQKHTLEERVIERTQDLHDALLAAQSAGRAKGEFLATMSHELRTPLTCVIGLSATLLRWSFGQLTAKQREYLQTIHDNGEHLLELINDILDLSQLEAGKTALNITECSLSQIAQESLQNVKQKAAQRGVELAIGLRVEAHQDRFLADPKRVKQILFNLLYNGIKFTPSGGKVILRVWLEGNTAVFQVEDTGIGIPEHQLPLLFQKFQQLDTSYRRQYEGTGLGLALTKQLVELQRGRIEVESVVDAGSIFTFWLPMPPSTAISNGLRIHSGFNSPQGRIVLIENDEETANLTCNILTAAGYQTVWIVESTTAIKQIEILQPLAAIVEINLSGMNGYDVIQQLRKSSAVPDLKILAIASNEIPKDTAKGSSIEPDDYLLKPIQPKQLLEKIQLLIANNN